MLYALSTLVDPGIPCEPNIRSDDIVRFEPQLHTHITAICHYAFQGFQRGKTGGPYALQHPSTQQDLTPPLFSQFWWIWAKAEILPLALLSFSYQTWRAWVEHWQLGGHFRLIPLSRIWMCPWPPLLALNVIYSIQKGRYWEACFSTNYLSLVPPTSTQPLVSCPLHSGRF